jgi:RTX calcium-binding nonapeptide repeat (4 copies)
MPVTTTYSTTLLSQTTMAGGAAYNLSLATTGSIASGTAGFVAAGIFNTALDNVDINVFNNTGGLSSLDFGVLFDPASNMYGTAVAGLSNGNIVVVGEDLNSIHYTIRNSAGAVLVANTDIAASGVEESPAVTGTAGGGFVIAESHTYSLTDHDIQLRFFNSSGVQTNYVSVDQSLAFDYRPAITALANGNVAVAWTRTDAAGTSSAVWYAVYDSGGTIVKAPSSAGTIGAGFDAEVSITSNANGFYIAFKDAFYSGAANSNITVARFSDAGVNNGFVNISSDTTPDYNPTITTLSNGMLAVAYDTFVGGDGDSYIALVDPTTLTLLNTTSYNGPAGGQSNNVYNSAAAGYGLGQLAVFHTNGTTSAGEGATYQYVRTSTGDAAVDIIVGDSFVDNVDGGGGNDYIYTFANNDLATGGLGNDVIFLGDGNDNGYGGAGIDYLYGGTGSNLLVGDAGTDILVSEGFGDLMLGGSSTTGTGGGAAGEYNYYYILNGAVTPTVFGDNSIDVYVDLSTTPVNGLFYGGGGQDYFFGGSGNDSVFGDDGSDVLFGGAGNDTLSGGLGINYSTGGAGNDTFVVNVTDGIQLLTDFVGGGTDDVVRLIGTSFTNFTQVRAALTAVNSGMILTVDADTQIWFLGLNATSLTASDFLFA